MESKEYYLENIDKLDTTQLRSFNRYYLHSNDQRCCKSCHKIFDGIKENFHIKKYYADGAVGYRVNCRECTNSINRKRIEQYRKDVKPFIGKRLTQIRSRANEQNLPFDLDSDYLYDLWIKSDGKCYYTGFDISFDKIRTDKKTSHDYQPSLDKKDPTLGYVKGNVIWCANIINTMKNKSTFNEFISICGLIYERNKVD